MRQRSRAGVSVRQRDSLRAWNLHANARAGPQWTVLTSTGMARLQRRPFNGSGHGPGDPVIGPKCHYMERVEYRGRGRVN